MKDNVVFNDASLPFPSDRSPEKEIFDFFNSLSILFDCQISIIRRDEVVCDWANLHYSDTFSFGEWLNRNLETDQRRFISSVMGKVPCPFSPKARNFFDDRIFVLACDDKVDVDAIGFASHLDVATLSFSSSEIWARNECLILEHLGDQTTEEKTVQNIGSSCRAKLWAEQVSAARRQNLDFFKDLSVEHNPDFPNLIFCDSILKIWRRPGPWCSYRSDIIEALKKLNDAIDDCSSLGDLIEKTGLDISEESSSTSTNPKFRRQRMFKHPKLGKTYFGAHVKNFGDSKRLYFLPDFPQSKICVGYFGNHLGTTSNPT